MRVSDKMKFDQVRANVNRNHSSMAKLQNQAATQKRVTKPSDDPVAAARVLTNRVELAGQNQYMKNVDYAKSFLQFTDQSLADLTELISRVKELALGQASDAGANEQSRRVVGTEVDQIHKQMIHVGNRKHGDRFIFSGYKTTVRPFDQHGNYKGDQGEMLIHVDKDSFVSMNLPGNKVFLGESLTADGISHSTAEQPRTVEELQNALEQDRIDKEEKEQRQQQTQMRGLASVNQQERVALNDEFYEQATTDVREGKNVFNVVKNLQVSLMTDDKRGIQDSLEALDEAMDQVVLARAQVGSRVAALDHSQEALSKFKVDTQGGISQLEDADLYEVVSEMNKTENTLQATLKSSGKIMQPSLMDFLR